LNGEIEKYLCDTNYNWTEHQKIAIAVFHDFCYFAIPHFTMVNAISCNSVALSQWLNFSAIFLVLNSDAVVSKIHSCNFPDFLPQFFGFFAVVF